MAENTGWCTDPGSHAALRAYLHAAAQAAEAHDFVMALPQGCNTPVGERGLQLSGGQRQRLTLALARTNCKYPLIAILDKALWCLQTGERSN